MPAFEDLTGLKFGRLTVIEKVENPDNKDTMWKCKCECGNEAIVSAGNLKSGTTKSCGCYRSETTSINNINEKTIHGYKGTLLYGKWSSMKHRAETEYADFPERYVCDEWRISFDSFADWSIPNGYQPGLSIDRIENAGPYSPENCRWATPDIQNNNKTSNRYIEYENERYTLSQFSQKIGMNPNTVRYRLEKGMSPEEIAAEPVSRKEHYIDYDGNHYTIAEWARAKGMSVSLIYSRIQNGWDDVRAITTPPPDTGCINGIYYVDDDGKPIKEI